MPYQSTMNIASSQPTCIYINWSSCK